MAKSEIDDIFAARGKTGQPSTVSTATSSSKSATKKDKKRKRKVEAEADPPTKKVETIIDPSAGMPSAKRAKVTTKAVETTKSSTKRSVKEDADKFKDSRGSGPRRKTEEGWSIYKADELGIGDDDEGGDTPLCPFDCDCCF